MANRAKPIIFDWELNKNTKTLVCIISKTLELLNNLIKFKSNGFKKLIKQKI